MSELFQKSLGIVPGRVPLSLAALHTNIEGPPASSAPATVPPFGSVMEAGKSCGFPAASHAAKASTSPWPPTVGSFQAASEPVPSGMGAQFNPPKTNEGCPFALALSTPHSGVSAVPAPMRGTPPRDAL
jgi:hypothetical protein